ncbi:glycosyltransferase [Neolewinella sp.]|uniref:glycosyltransferase n=1 Tax=Neolewinella sp. TaxID=2993543 RepID=UPI003B51D538
MAVLLLLATAVQLTAWWWVYRPALTPHSSSLPTEPAAEPPPVTVIVCFHNEATHLEATLRGILSQDYPHFELLAVDDNSADASVAIVRYLQDRHPQLRLLQPGPTRPGKKDALTAGIQAARHPLLLLTDADCAPASEHWLRHMVAPLTHGNQLVLGCSPYRYRPGALAWWQRFEATQTALQYQGFARMAHPYMGVGRNLAYHRSFFTAAGGFAAHAHHLGGDDDLLVNAHAVPSLTARITNPAAWTYSEPTRNWWAYLRQKVRHQSVGMHYRSRHQLVLALLALSHGGSYLLGALLLFTPYWPLAVVLYLLRACTVVSVYRQPSVQQFAGGAPIAIGGAASFGVGARILLGDMLLAPFYLFALLATALPPRRW